MYSNGIVFKVFNLARSLSLSEIWLRKKSKIRIMYNNRKPMEKKKKEGMASNNQDMSFKNIMKDVKFFASKEAEATFECSVSTDEETERERREARCWTRIGFLGDLEDSLGV
ncbi:PREDICTED: uncharacterized protein LOC104724322 [Camelina sativa]|uniref:Uncharacterized protein LOC104724322 n=1 Tax=Camelina sativa TaxID=90675 RepID=A0ABM1QPV9_CAMSA|nr:PREDICTED: uncharacterized protein LOC104724322 [Camelina sativa]